MKKLLAIFIIAASMAACTNSADSEKTTTDSTTMTTDTTQTMSTDTTNKMMPDTATMHKDPVK